MLKVPQHNRLKEVLYCYQQKNKLSMKLNGENYLLVFSGSAYYSFWKISAVVVRVSFVVLKHYDQKQLGMGRVCLVFLYRGKPRQDLKMDRNLETGADQSP